MAANLPMSPIPRPPRILPTFLPLVALLALISFGAKKQSCIPKPPKPVCVVPEDCSGLIHPECVGSWTCGSAGQCVWECEQQTLGCYGDNDCPADTHCNAAEVCKPDPSCPQCAVCYGECVPDQAPTCVVSGCSGEICGPASVDSICLMQDWFKCLKFTTCGNNGPGGACSWAQTSEFQKCLADLNSGCTGNDDCPPGEICQYDYPSCPPGAFCALPADANSSSGSSGSGTSEAKPIAPPNGKCVPEPTDQCKSDKDCAKNETCVLGPCPLAPCTFNEATGETFCPPCYGTCEPKPPTDKCQSDADCLNGEVCKIQICVDCVQDATNPACGCWGTCEPEITPGECHTDKDCAKGEQCMLKFCSKAPCIFDDTTGDWNCPPPCTGTCEPKPEGCTNDSDCAKGEQCKINVCPACAPGTPSDLCQCWGTCEPTTKTCGGIMGEICAPGQFCNQPAGMCKGADIQGLCVDVPKGCEKIWKPVCGCDGKTYGNDCMRILAGVQLDHAGTCDKPKYNCQNDKDCAANETCELQICVDCIPGSTNPACGCWGTCKPKLDPGQCQSDKDCKVGEECVPTPCPLAPCSIDPATGTETCPACYGTCKPTGVKVCGGLIGLPCPDGQHCEFPPGTCNVFDMGGVCVITPDLCPLIYAPVCGCDGKTYGNKCEARAAGAQIDHKGACKPKYDCQGDEDCAANETCQIQICVKCLPDYPGPECGCWGTCEPKLKPGQCQADSDCAKGEQCKYGVCPLGACTPDWCPPCYGTCEPVKPPPACKTACDCYDAGLPFDKPCPLDCATCDNYWTCEAGQCKQNCGPTPAGASECVPPPCTNDKDCSNGETCQCLPDPNCPLCDVCYFGCAPAPPPPPKTCVKTGCSGQICAGGPIISTCEWLPWYACFKLAACEPQADGGCGWTSNPEFEKCMKGSSQGGFGTPSSGGGSGNTP